MIQPLDDLSLLHELIRVYEVLQELVISMSITIQLWFLLQIVCSRLLFVRLFIPIHPVIGTARSLRLPPSILGRSLRRELGFDI